MNINDLTPEQKLSDDQLQAIASGWIRESADDGADGFGGKDVLGSCRLG